MKGVVYVCQACGQSFSKWQGRCGTCQEWNTLIEESVRSQPRREGSMGASRDVGMRSVPQKITEVTPLFGPRPSTGIGEMDRVLGGGLVEGSAILLGGEPGIGKSTLLLQVAASFARTQGTVLYVSAEESASQVALRAQRVKIDTDRLYLLSEVELEAILEHAEALKPLCLMIDSIQTIHSSRLEAASGSVGQMRACAAELVQRAKRQNQTLFLIGHVTKEGTLAGPKVLEHMVDCVLYFEETAGQPFRLLRAMKNRFGSTQELGVFHFTAEGIASVNNPSQFFLSPAASLEPGSAVVASLQGSRPVLVVVETLVTPSPLAMPRRTFLGIDSQQVALWIAILEKRARLKFYDQDVFLNVVGGLRLQEPAVGLGVCAALLSARHQKCFPPKSLFLGEVGLGGEVRPVVRLSDRLQEAARIGFQTCFIPASKAEEREGIPPELAVVPLAHVQAMLEHLL